MSDVITTTQNSKSNDTRIGCYNFSIEIIRFLDILPDRKVYWVIGDQLLRSATSIGANIVEAKAASSRRDFIKFYEIALKSANERQYWIGLLNDATSVDKNIIKKLSAELKEICKMLGASLLTLKNKRF